MRIAVYGGSFNPPHVVHAMVASWLLWTDLVDEVWLVPVYRHAFEGIQEKKLASYNDRVAWCTAFTEEVDPRITVSDIESRLPIPSYSVDTLQALSQEYPEHDFRLCVGADVIPDLPKWKSWDVIEREFAPIIVGRVGYDSPDDIVKFPPVSSSEIRKKLSFGEIPSHFLLHLVVELLKVKNPYLR